jgi:DNA-binding NarL/FixJ family response regulator
VEDSQYYRATIVEKFSRAVLFTNSSRAVASEEDSVEYVRVLVVDDYQPWRRFVSSELQKRPELQVICEVSDGLDAVHKAQELRPDLILLDIGLPTLNGMEAARQIRKFDTKPKIIFLTQESSPDIMQEALSLGAEGYLVKACAATELLTAVEAVLRGKEFVSSGVAGHDLRVLDSQEAPHRKAESDRSLMPESSDGTFRVDMDLPMPVDLPEEEQIHRILRGSYVGDCNDAQAKMYGLESAKDLIGRRLAEMVAPDDSKNIELTREFIRAGYRTLHKKSYEVDALGNSKVFLNSMTGVVVDGKLITTWGRQSDITEQACTIMREEEDGFRP